MEFPRNVEFNRNRPKSQQSHVSETRIAADLFFHIRISILKAAYRYSKEVIEIIAVRNVKGKIMQIYVFKDNEIDLSVRETI